MRRSWAQEDFQFPEVYLWGAVTWTINAVTKQVGPNMNLSGNPTVRELVDLGTVVAGRTRNPFIELTLRTRGLCQ